MPWPATLKVEVLSWYCPLPGIPLLVNMIQIPHSFSIGTTLIERIQFAMGWSVTGEAAERERCAIIDLVLLTGGALLETCQCHSTASGDR